MNFCFFIHLKCCIYRNQKCLCSSFMSIFKLYPKSIAQQFYPIIFFLSFPFYNTDLLSAQKKMIKILSTKNLVIDDELDIKNKNERTEDKVVRFRSHVHKNRNSECSETGENSKSEKEKQGQAEKKSETELIFQQFETPMIEMFKQCPQSFINIKKKKKVLVPSIAVSVENSEKDLRVSANKNKKASRSKSCRSSKSKDEMKIENQRKTCKTFQLNKEQANRKHNINQLVETLKNNKFCETEIIEHKSRKKQKSFKMVSNFLKEDKNARKSASKNIGALVLDLESQKSKKQELHFKKTTDLKRGTQRQMKIKQQEQNILANKNNCYASAKFLQIKDFNIEKDEKYQRQFKWEKFVKKEKKICYNRKTQKNQQGWINRRFEENIGREYEQIIKKKEKELKRLQFMHLHLKATQNNQSILEGIQNQTKQLVDSFFNQYELQMELKDKQKSNGTDNIGNENKWVNFAI